MIALTILMGCGGGSLKTVTLPVGSSSWIAPANVARIEIASGRGAPGQDGGEYYVDQYDEYFTNYQVRRDTGETIVLGPNYSGTYSGSAPADYCNPPLSSPGNSSFSSSQTCFSFSDSSYTETQGPTTGASATAFGRTFPGSTGNVTPTTISFDNIAVTPGQGYPIYIPPGGSITISYYE